MPQAESRSADLVSENLELLKQIFPEVIKEGRVDLEALHDLLGSYSDTAEERFGLNWAGKPTHAVRLRNEAQARCVLAQRRVWIGIQPRIYISKGIIWKC